MVTCKAVYWKSYHSAYCNVSGWKGRSKNDWLIDLLSRVFFGGGGCVCYRNSGFLIYARKFLFEVEITIEEFKMYSASLYKWPRIYHFTAQ